MHTRDIRKLISNLTFLTGGEVVGKILTFAAFTFLARVLGPKHFGYLEFTIALLVFLTLMTDSGTSTYGARETAKNKERPGELVAGIIAIRMALAATGYLILIVLTGMLPPRQAPAGRLILIYGLSLFANSGFLQWIFQGSDRMKRVAAGSLIRQAVFTAGVFLLIHREDQFWQIGWIECAATSALVVYNLISLRPGLRNLNLRFDSQTVKNTFVQSFPIGISEMSWALSWYLPAILLGWMAGPKLVGWFGAANRPVIALHTFVWLYFYNLLPSLSRATATSQEDLQKILHRSMRFAAWSAVFIGIAGTILARPLILLIFGNEYTESIRIFRILIWVVPVALLSGHYRYVLIAANHQKYEMISSICGAAVCLLLSRFGIRYYGMDGAAPALLAASIVNWALAYFFVQKKITRIPFAKHILKPAIVGAVMVVIFMILLPIHPWLAVTVSFFTFGLLFLALQPEWKKLLPTSGHKTVNAE